MSDEDRAKPSHLGTDPPRNFKLGVEERVRALTIGAPAYALRKRKIEDLEAEWIETLALLHDTLVEKGRSSYEARRAVVSRAESFDLSRVNRLVDAHNRWYPIEANLPMDLDGNYLVSGRVWREESPFTAERLVASALGRIDRRSLGE